MLNILTYSLRVKRFAKENVAKRKPKHKISLYKNLKSPKQYGEYEQLINNYCGTLKVVTTVI